MRVAIGLVVGILGATGCGMLLGNEDKRSLVAAVLCGAVGYCGIMWALG